MRGSTAHKSSHLRSHTAHTRSYLRGRTAHKSSHLRGRTAHTRCYLRGCTVPMRCYLHGRTAHTRCYLRGRAPHMDVRFARARRAQEPSLAPARTQTRLCSFESSRLALHFSCPPVPLHRYYVLPHSHLPFPLPFCSVLLYTSFLLQSFLPLHIDPLPFFTLPSTFLSTPSHPFPPLLILPFSLSNILRLFHLSLLPPFYQVT